MKWILKREIKLKIKKDPDLFAFVCKVLNVSPYTLPDLLRRNDPQLTQKAVLLVLAEALEISENDLLENDSKVKIVSE